MNDKKSRALKGGKGKGSSKSETDDLDQFKVGLKLVDVIGKKADKLSQVSMLNGEKGFGDVYEDLDSFFGLVREYLDIAGVTKSSSNKAILKSLLAKTPQTNGLVTAADFGNNEAQFASCSGAWDEMVLVSLADVVLCYLRVRDDDANTIGSSIAASVPFSRESVAYIKGLVAQLGNGSTRRQIVTVIGAYLTLELFRNAAPRVVLADISSQIDWWIWATNGINSAAELVALYVSKGTALAVCIDRCRVLERVPTFFELMKEVAQQC